MSIALRHETWILPFQVWGSWACTLSVSILCLLGTVIDNFIHNTILIFSILQLVEKSTNDLQIFTECPLVIKLSSKSAFHLRATLRKLCCPILSHWLESAHMTVLVISRTWKCLGAALHI